jgi:hypothetical protein
MALKKKGNGSQARSVLPAEEASVSHRPTHDQIRRRAYQIYLERGARPGHELDDWLRAERELERIALFTRSWNRLSALDERRSLNFEGYHGGKLESVGGDRGSSEV